MPDIARTTAARVSQLARSPRTLRIGWWALGLIVAFGIIGALVVPPVAKHYLVETLSRELKREVTINSLRINPYALSATVRGFVMKDRSGPEPALTFDELYVNASLASLFRMAPVLEGVRLVKPRLRFVRGADRRYSFQDLLDDSASQPGAPEAVPLRFAVANIEVVDGRVDFDDQLEGVKHSLADIQLGVPFVSSLPVHQNINVEPRFAARLNDTPVELRAKSKPFKNSHDSTVSLEIRGLDLLRFLEYAPEEFPVKVRSAKLDTALDITFAQPPDRPPSITLAGTAGLRDVEVTEPGGDPLLKLPRLTAEFSALEPLANRYQVEKVLVESPEIRLYRPKGGEVYLLRLFEAKESGTAKPAADAGRPLTFSVGEVALTGGKVDALDERSVRPVRTTFDELRATVRNISSAKDAVGEFEVFVHDTRDEALSAAGRFGLQPIKAEGTLKLERLQLADVSPYVESFVVVQAMDGTLDAATSFAYAADDATVPTLTLSGLEATLRSLVLRQQWDRRELARLAELTAKNVELDLRRRTVTVGELASSNARFAVKREQDGLFNLQRLVSGRPESAPATGPRPASASDEQPWSFVLKKLAVARYALVIEDERAGPAATARIDNLSVAGENLSNAKGARGSVGTRFRVNRTGSFAAHGQVGVNPVSTRLRVDARNVGILPLQPYFAQYVNAVVSGGEATVNGAVALDLRDGEKPTGTFRGDFELGDFAAVTKTASEDLLRWKSLRIGGIDTTIEPLKVDVRELALSDFYARLIVNADGTLNLQGLLRSPEERTDEAVAAEPAGTTPPGSPPAPSRSPLPISIGRIALQSGNVNFSDFFIKPNYSANLTGVGGTVTEITPQHAGDVELHGRIDETAPVEIRGRVNPLAAQLFVDLKANAKDIELPPLSPYAVKYAGYGIEKGKLSVDVKYLIENSKLVAENNIYLDQLTFGEKVESPTATKLPVQFAVSLLKDRNGVIDLNLPVSGSLDDPQFRLGGVIIRVIGNLITKAVTAPFALLGAAFGGGEELAYVDFAPGSAALDAADEKKLATLAKALGDRPALKLDVAGRVDPATDREGLSRAAVEREVKAAKLKEITKGGEAAGSLEQVTLAPDEYAKYLAAAYRDAKFEKPRNIIGIARTLPVPEMEKLMLANASATDEDLRLLANRRAQATKDWLVGKGGIPADRVFLIAPKLTAEGIKDKGRPERVDFSLK
jgi:uncharacterized protein involved in outer membrane biogenesis